MVRDIGGGREAGRPGDEDRPHGERIGRSRRGKAQDVGADFEELAQPLRPDHGGKRPTYREIPPEVAEELGRTAEQLQQLRQGERPGATPEDDNGEEPSNDHLTGERSRHHAFEHVDSYPGAPASPNEDAIGPAGHSHPPEHEQPEAAGRTGEDGRRNNDDSRMRRFGRIAVEQSSDLWEGLHARANDIQTAPSGPRMPVSTSASTPRPYGHVVGDVDDILASVTYVLFAAITGAQAVRKRWDNSRPTG